MIPFIIDEEKRNEELKTIYRFLEVVPSSIKELFIKKIGNINSYISFNHFVYTNSLDPSMHQRTVFRSQGYMKEDTAFIWIPHPRSTIYSLGREQSEVDFINRVIKIISILETNHHPKKWIFDFRNNGGGLAASFISIITPFLKNLTLDLRSNSGEKVEFTADEEEFHWTNIGGSVISDRMQRPFCIDVKNKDNIHVILNNGSASGSEISTYFFKKYLKATIHGYPSMGALSTMADIYINGVFIIYPYTEIIDKKIIKNNRLYPDVEGYNQVGI